MGLGFQKPSRATGTKEVRLARISYDEEATRCSCGWARPYGRAPREKVIEDAVDRHLTKNHGGRGIRL